MHPLIHYYDLCESGTQLDPAGYSLATHKFIIVHRQRAHAKGFYKNKFDEFSKNVSKIGGIYTRNKKTPWKWGKLESWLPNWANTITFHVLGPWDMESWLGLPAKTIIFSCLSSEAARISLWTALPWALGSLRSLCHFVLYQVSVICDNTIKCLIIPCTLEVHICQRRSKSRFVASHEFLLSFIPNNPTNHFET